MGVRKEAVRVAKFSVVGTVAFIIDFLLFNLLRLEWVGIGPLWAKVISVTVATTVSWLGSRYWTFRDGRNQSAGKEALWFFLVNAGGLLIAMACLWISHYVLGFRSALADNISANIIGVGLGNIFRYFMYRLVIYRVTPRRPPQHREVINLGG
jgi:putative flippase GtrA